MIHPGFVTTSQPCQFHTNPSCPLQALNSKGQQGLTCSPETDPATMRVRRPKMGKKRRILDEEETPPRADRAQTPRGGGRVFWPPGSRSPRSPEDSASARP